MDKLFQQEIIISKTIELTPELVAAITIVFDDGEQNHDRGDPKDDEQEKAYELVKQLTEYADK